MNGGDAREGETDMNDYNEIGARLRELREVSDYTIEELAAELRLSPEVYASYEENGKDVPISVIYEIANKFKVDFTEIVTGQSAKLETYHLIRRGGGKVINRNPEYHFEDLAYRYANKVMQPLLVTLEPTDAVAKLITHAGQEFNLVLEGVVIVTLGDKEFEMKAGDSIYFNPTIPHGQRCGSDVKARFLTVIAE
jgi:transcriptional regulator with XRE-family HTH domain